MKRIHFILFATMLSTTAMAQKATVRGVLKDSVLNETEPYATVRVYKAGNLTKPVAMSVTGADGSINQSVNGKGQYIITLNSVGKKEVRRSFTLNGESSIDLGSICTADDSKALSNVEVVAQKPIVKMETDKMTYNVQEDVDSKTMTVLDMLRKVPMVVVDGQDNITVKGSSSFKIYVDGKPNQMFNNNASQIFKAMPSSMVKNIEVITNPGAKYDAEGTTCILNLTMNHDNGQGSTNLNGYNGSIHATASNRGWNAGASINGQQGKLTYSADGFYNYHHMAGTTIEMSRTQISESGNSTIDYRQESTIKQPFAMGNFSMGYELDSMSTINATAGITYFERKFNGQPTTSYQGGIYGNGYSYSNDMNQKSRQTGFNGSIDWERFFNKERTRSLSVSYQFESSPNKDEDYRKYKDVPDSTTLTLNDIYSDNKTESTTHTAQIDYTTPFLKNHTLNFGAKYINRRNTSDSKYYDIVNDQQVYNEGNSMKYRNIQSIVAGYAECRGSFGKLNTVLGMRYEETWQNVKYLLGEKNNFKTNYGNFVPSLSIGYSITPMMNIGINYAMHILRPSIDYMNPYVDKSSPIKIEYGNPNLEVEKSQNVGLVFNLFTQKFMLNATLSQNICNNQIAEYSFLDNNKILNTTYGNIVKNRWTNFNAYARWTITKSTSVMINANGDYGDMRSNQLNQKNHGWQASSYVGLMQTLPWQLKWNVGCFAKTKDYNIQGWSGGMGFFNTSFTKSLFKDKLDLSLMYATSLTGKLKIKEYSKGSDYVQNTNINIPIQMVRFTVTWHFGNTKKQFQQHQTKINNDFGGNKSDDKQISGMGTGGM